MATCSDPGSRARSLPFLKLMPEIDAVVTDEESIVAGGPVMQAWHSLRVAQRHQTMSSLGLSRRLPGVTGRMSIHSVGPPPRRVSLQALEHGRVEPTRRGRRTLYSVRRQNGDDRACAGQAAAVGHRRADARQLRRYARGSSRALALGPNGRPVHVVVSDRAGVCAWTP